MLTATLSAFGGGGTAAPGNSANVTTYLVGATAGTGGNDFAREQAVNAGSTMMLTLTANSGYVVNAVTGCGGALSGNSYTTGTINANWSVAASFAPAFTWISGSNTPGTTGVYGTLGIAAAPNVPRARDGEVTWTDGSGNFLAIRRVRGIHAESLCRRLSQ